MIEKKKPLEVWFRFDEEGKLEGAKFLFLDLSIEEKDKLYELAKGESKPWLRRLEDDDVDSMKLTELKIMASIIGWEGVTNEFLLNFMDPDKMDDWEFFGDKEADTQVPYNKKNLELIAKNFGFRFAKYFYKAGEFVGEVKRIEKRKQLKNSSTSSQK